MKKVIVWVIGLVLGISFVFIPKICWADGKVGGHLGKELGPLAEEEKIGTAKMDIKLDLADALFLYELEIGMYPTTEQGLSALVEKPTTEPLPPLWRGPFLKTVPKDPWGNPYIYINPGVHNKERFDLSSYGPDGIESEDDINSWD